MEFIDGENLEDFIKHQDYNITFVKKCVKTLHDVSEALLLQSIAHRDIKPSNIMITKAQNVIVMDLGVLKHIGVPSHTDEYEKEFIGTLRYAAPEYLAREEQDTLDGWRAINLYQIGGVLHDLITKKELFSEKRPYAKLVDAIFYESPVINVSEYSFDTNQLARDLLLKDYKKRLQICSNARIDNYCKTSEEDDSLDQSLTKLLSPFSANKEKYMLIAGLRKNNEEKQAAREKLNIDVKSFLKTCFDQIKLKGIISKYDFYPSLEFPLSQQLQGSFIIPKTITDHEIPSQNGYLDLTFLVKVEGEYSQGFAHPIYMLIRVQNDDTSHVIISAVSAYIDVFKTKHLTKNNSDKIIHETSLEIISKKKENDYLRKIKSAPIFNGSFFNDVQIQNYIILNLIRTLKPALDHAHPHVQGILDSLEARERGEEVHYHNPLPAKTIFFNQDN